MLNYQRVLRIKFFRGYVGLLKGISLSLSHVQRIIVLEVLAWHSPKNQVKPPFQLLVASQNPKNIKIHGIHWSRTSLKFHGSSH
jgi:hypothetical protein